MRLSAILALAGVLVVTGIAHASTPSVPLPDSLVLVVTGAVGVVGYAWWSRRKK